MMLRGCAVALVGALAVACSSGAGEDTASTTQRSVTDSTSITKMPDGRFRAECTDAKGQTYEQIVTAAQIHSDQVCTHTASGPAALGSLIGGAMTLPATFDDGPRVFCGVNQKLVLNRNGTVSDTQSACPTGIYDVGPDGVLGTYGNGLRYVPNTGAEKLVDSALPETLYCENAGKVLGQWGNGLWSFSMTASFSQLTTAKSTKVFGCVGEHGMVSSFGNGTWLSSYDGTQKQLTNVVLDALYGKNANGVFACFGNGVWLMKWDGTQTQFATTCPDSLVALDDASFTGCWHNGTFRYDAQGHAEQTSATCDAN